MKHSGLFLFFTFLVNAECPAILPPGVTCNSIGNLTQIQLNQSATISWDTFRVAAGETMQFKGNFPVVNVSYNQASIHGDISSQGDFALISEYGIQQGASSHITAPNVLLSTMSGQPSTFTVPEEDGLLQLNGQVTANEIVLLGRQIEIGKEAKLQAASDVQMLAMHQSPVTKSGTTYSPQNFSPSANSTASVSQHGTIHAHHVTIISEGYLTNTGKITTSGSGNSVHLTAQQIWHDGNSTGFITTGALTQSAASIIQVSPYFDPNDGQNPGSISSSVQFDDLHSEQTNTQVTANLQPSQHTSTTKTNFIIPSPHPAQKKAAELAARNIDTNGKKKKSKNSKVLFFGKVMDQARN